MNANLTLDSDIVVKVKELRMKRKYQWLRLGLNEDETAVVVLECGEPGSTYDKMLESAPKNVVSFFVWDDKSTNKVFAINYSHDNNVKVAQKMVGATAWIQLKGTLESNGCKTLDAHDEGEIQYSEMSKKFK